MSRYHVDKVCWQIAQDDGHRHRFLTDPEGFLAGRDLTDQERRALVERDYVTLYRLGAHPFLLWSWGRRVIDPSLEFTERYAEAVKPYGRPNFAT